MPTHEHTGTGIGWPRLSQFPPEPSVRALWAPIRLEPIAHSGERITIGVVAVPEQGAPAVASALQPDAVKCVFGAQAEQFLAVVGLVLDDLRAHLRTGADLAQWLPPVHGASLDTAQPGAGDNIADIIRQGLRRTACFSALLAASSDELEPEEDQVDRWPILVRRAVEARAPQLAGNFKKQVRLRDQARPTEIDYYSPRAAIGLGKLRPFCLAGDVRWAKAKLMDLENLRGRQGMFPAEHHQILLYRPHDDDASFTVRQMTALAAAVIELESYADDHQIRVDPVYDAEQACNRILRLERAA